VTWRDDASLAHTVTSGRAAGVDAKGKPVAAHPSGLFDGKLAGRGKTFSFRFTRIGTYSYYCSIHKGMRGIVVVMP
jgi:plastocyanin